MTQLITALVSIHSSMTFLADMYSLLDPPSRTISDGSLFPVDDVIGFIHMVKIQEDARVEEALRACGYPQWSFSKVRCQMEFIGDKRKKKNKKQEA